MTLFLLFLYGLLAASGALFIESFLLALLPLDTITLTIFILIAALIEETAKGLLLWRFLNNHTPPALSSLATGLIFGAGFSSLELGLITLGMRVFPLGAIWGILSVHLLTSIAFAWFLSGPSGRKLPFALALTLILATLHALYNFLALS